ncbi:uncharacterized protein LOC133286227 [Gastrolobium bilobum]|uniref:uncharacterized protein LOC133286227 n=1 Tax=Gastrolobium bilobum TaxID=150636 RepID=UPI002AAF2C66|nr:uncharacterized protein LOC133286227 [Gastrolobium bilobum]
MRDDEGRWLGGFCGRLGFGNSLVAELRGFLEGVEQTKKAGFRNVCFEGDSLVAVNLIKNGCEENHPLAHLVNRIKMTIADDWNTVITHTHREGNMLADWLAAYAHQLDN